MSDPISRMCRRRGDPVTVYTRPDRSPLGNLFVSTLDTKQDPDPATNKYEAFCALCGLGLIYRMKCAKVELSGLGEPRELLVRGVPLEGRQSQRRNEVSETSWSKNAIGIELDLTTRTIGETWEVRAPYVHLTCERSQTVYGNHIESISGGDYILARIPRRTIPIPPGFAPTFNWDTATASPAAGASTASAADTAAAASSPARAASPEKVTYLIHTRCHDIFKLACARENVPWDQRNNSARVRLRRSPGSTYSISQASSGYGEQFTPDLNGFAACVDATPGPSLHWALTSISSTNSHTNTTTTATSNNPNQNLELLLPALFTALHNLGRIPGKNYWSEKDYKFDSEADFPGLAESMNAYGFTKRTIDGDTAEAADLHTTGTPHLGIVSSRHVWPHLNPQDDRDEFCPEIDYTGAALVAVADPLCYFLEGQDTLILPGPPSGSTSTSAATSIPPNYSTLLNQSPSPGTYIWSPSQRPSPPRINPYGTSTATDPFTVLPPELLLQILTYLSIPHISSLRLSSRCLAAFIHPTSELPTSYFRDAFCSGGEFEFIMGVLPHPRGTMPWDAANILQGAGGVAKEVDWRGLYRKVQYALEANPKPATRQIGRRYYTTARKWDLGDVVVPRSPGLANRRRIWGVAGRVAREMRRLMMEWEAGEGCKEKDT